MLLFLFFRIDDDIVGGYGLSQMESHGAVSRPTAHSHPHYALKKYAFYNKMYILRIISGFL